MLLCLITWQNLLKKLINPNFKYKKMINFSKKYKNIEIYVLKLY